MFFFFFKFLTIGSLPNLWEDPDPSETPGMVETELMRHLPFVGIYYIAVCPHRHRVIFGINVFVRYLSKLDTQYQEIGTRSDFRNSPVLGVNRTFDEIGVVDRVPDDESFMNN